MHFRTEFTPSHPAVESVSTHRIKNIIFDFGGVICNIDVTLTEHAFHKLGLQRFDKKKAVTDTAGLFEQFETGRISPDDFRCQVRSHFGSSLSDQVIDEAWNALLLDIPPERIRILEGLRKNYRIFLLSNSNKIHYDHYLNDFRIRYGFQDFDALFEKAWFSFNIGLKKPDPTIFKFVLQYSGLQPDETLFIDDTLIHVVSAQRTGLNAHHLKIADGRSILDIFK
jgi:putative hydrolase of the HAD superfamily